MADTDELIQQAGSPKDTPFDYIVIGSGAGGGTLAARLAESGRTVLLLEAGIDPAYPPDQQKVHTTAPREVYEVPGYHAAATEDSGPSARGERPRPDGAVARTGDVLRAVPLQPSSLHRLFLGHHRCSEVHRARRRRHPAPAPEGAPAARRPDTSAAYPDRCPRRSDRSSCRTPYCPDTPRAPPWRCRRRPGSRCSSDRRTPGRPPAS